MREATARKLAEAEAAEAAHEDGSAEHAFLEAMSISRLTAAQALGAISDGHHLDPPEILEEIGRQAAARAEQLCWALQRRGYEAKQIGTLLHAACTSEPGALRAAFTLFERHGAIDRTELVRALQPWREVLASRLFGRALDSAATVTQLERVGYNEFAALLRRGTLRNDGTSFHRRGGGSHKGRDAQILGHADRHLERLVPRRLRSAFAQMRANMADASFETQQARAVLRAMFVSQVPFPTHPRPPLPALARPLARPLASSRLAKRHPRRTTRRCCRRGQSLTPSTVAHSHYARCRLPLPSLATRSTPSTSRPSLKSSTAMRPARLS